MSTPAPVDEPALAPLLELNNRNAAELSWLDAPRLAELVRRAFHARRIGTVDAFLLAFDQDADYDSTNFLWFRERYPRFVYVDRIAVDASARGRGLARLLYDDLFVTARAAGHSLITCEINVDPPNPGSEAFHAALGFRQVGSAAIHGGTKRVRYYERTL
ncbi:MAG: GNAT family N-acetyltransferase [Rhizobiaceae bacterium]|nr:GNAT family N-acetyltransferase [Rhizobiaceae bacterium]